MKVLLPIIWHDLTHCVARAFREAGHEVRVVDWRRIKRGRRRPLIEPHIIQEAQAFKPDLAFCQFQSPDIITHRLPSELARMGCFTINWTGDVRHPLPQWYRNLAPFFNVTSFTNWTDVEAISAMGHRAEFLQVGYDEHIYHANGTGERSGIVFIGNNYSGNRFAESDGRRAMVHALHNAFGDRFKVYGIGWEPYGGRYVREPEDAGILRGASIAVGWDHFHRPGFASDRLLRATACGCAVVNQFYEGIAGEHPRVVNVKSVDEMVEAVRMLLERPDIAGHLGGENAANTIAQHRWHDRVKVIEQWM